MSTVDILHIDSDIIEIFVSEKKGRGIRAKRDIEPGETLIEELPYMCVPFRTYEAKKRCHVCFKQSDTTSLCLDCGIHWSCKLCDREYRKYHRAFECKLLELVQYIVESFSIDETLLVFLIKILSKIYVEKKIGHKRDFPFSNGSYEYIDLFLSHIDHFKKDEAWIKSIREAIEELFKFMPRRDIPFTVDDAIEICGKINSNSHGISDNISTFGIGIYPRAALFNHCCEPNAFFTSGYFDNDASKMICRSIQKIKKGEEITIHYIDLYQTRQERKKQLRETKFFECECHLCVEDISKSVDALVEGWYCDDKDCNGILVSQLSMNLGPEKDDWMCTICQKVTKKEVIEERIHKINKYIDKADFYHQSGRYDLAKKYLTSILESYANPKTNTHRMQPENSILVNVRLKLLNCCTRLNDHIGSLVHCQYIIRCFEKILPDELELSNYYEHIGDIIEEALKNEKSKEFAKTQIPLMKKSLEKSIIIRTNCLGESHPKTLEVKKRLSELEI